MIFLFPIYDIPLDRVLVRQNYRPVIISILITLNYKTLRIASIIYKIFVITERYVVDFNHKNHMQKNSYLHVIIIDS